MTTVVEYSKTKTSVWWDIENCEVPRGWNAHAVAQNIGSALLNMNYSGPVSILAYGDTNLIPHHVQAALSSTGVGLNHVPAGVKDASDKKILVDMLLWAVDNPAPANIMLISGDRDFSNALHQLSMRRYTILLAHPPHASAPLVAAAKNVWLWTSLASGGPPLTSGDSSGPVSNPVSEPAQFSKPTGSSSVARDTNLNSSDSFRARLSDKRHTSQAAFVASHKAHASVSVKPIKEGDVVEPVLCVVCQISCISKEVYASHVYGKRHRNNLELQSGKVENVSMGLLPLPKEAMTRQSRRTRGRQRKELIDSKKLQEKGVGEKSQPREERIAEPQFQSQDSQENNVAMVNQPEEVEEKGVGEKSQPVETITESQVQSQNTQENTKCLEKQSEELREILLATSESSSVKQRIPRTKDQADTVNKQESVKRECFNGIVKSLNQSEGATDNHHSEEVKKKKKQKEVVEHRAVRFRSMLCHLCVVICDSQGVSTLVCDRLHHWPNQKAFFEASEHVVWCRVCHISCKKAAYENHTNGEEHRHKLELQSDKNENMSKVQAKLYKEIAEKMKKSKDQTDKAQVDSRKSRDESDERAQEVKEEVKEINAVSENLVHAFNGLNRESRIPKESRGCLDVIPEKVLVPPDVNVSGKFEDESKHKQEREKECAGRGKERLGEAAKREESEKVQVDSLWTRLWWGKS